MSRQMTDVETAIAVVQAGAEVVRRHFGTTLARLDKGTSDFATNADIEAEESMLRVLREQRPDDSVLGEEEVFFAGDGGAFRRFRGEDVGLVPNGGSQLVDLNLDPPFPNAPRFRATTLAASTEFVARFHPRVVSSTMALTWVASGQRAAYVTDGDIMEKGVHFAAGVAVCEAAGCVVSDLWGQPWRNRATGLVASADARTHAVLMELIRDCPKGA